MASIGGVTFLNFLPYEAAQLVIQACIWLDVIVYEASIKLLMSNLFTLRFC